MRNPDVLSRRILDGEMVLVNGDTATSLALTNRTAVIIWEMADGRNSIQNIIHTISQEFQNVPAGVAADVQALLAQLARDGFIGYEWQENT